MITTERLFIQPLTYQQLLKYIKADNSLEQELKLNYTNRTISPELKEAFEQTIIPNVADPKKNYLYATLWTIIDAKANTMVGDICIVGEPNAAGEIEIGYGTYDEFKNKGYMTEAVGGMIKWASNQPNVTSIIASTKKNNVASYSILKKNNFTQRSESNELLSWKLDLQK